MLRVELCDGCGEPFGPSKLEAYGPEYLCPDCIEEAKSAEEDDDDDE